MFKIKSLPPEVRHIVVNKGTEYPGSGEYEDNESPGTYLCRQCGLALFRAESKFPSGCGWPSFDSEIDGAVKREPDKDGRRTEILCQRCDAHLGHVFKGEMMTYLNTRHCVNSLSIDWVSNTTVSDSEEIILAAGCFWGVEYYMKKFPGVLKTEVGYIGGTKDNPTYKEVCEKTTGHLEAVRIVFDPAIVNIEQIIKHFFEIHDQSQTNGQGPDLGPQYLSAIFYYTEEQKNIAKAVIELLKSKGHQVATSVHEVSTFWKAENYHQDYYALNNNSPYCHSWNKKF